MIIKLFCQKIILLFNWEKCSVMNHIENLSREALLRLIQVYARNWLAHDGCWFLAAEEKYGIETAI
jgi:hypothetical protein